MGSVGYRILLRDIFISVLSFCLFFGKKLRLKNWADSHQQLVFEKMSSVMDFHVKRFVEKKKTESNNKLGFMRNRARYTVIQVACGWARAVFVWNTGSAVLGYILITRNLQAEYIVSRISWSANQIWSSAILLFYYFWITFEIISASYPIKSNLFPHLK